MSTSSSSYQFHLPDMSCGHCVAAITEAAKALDAAATLEFDRDARQVRVQSEKPRQAWVEALSEAGYAPASA
ncbi:MAG: heavy-metal-associated domain-containing protein [Paucibacter sp.]|nr:heavy-metal-associated domain-containing protein [Roseateles sp.]